MNRFVYLINNRTGCKVRCVNPVFQYKLGLLIKKLKKYKNELKQNKISKELLLKIRKTLNETLSLLGINNKSSKSLSRSRSSTDSTNVNNSFKSCIAQNIVQIIGLLGILIFNFNCNYDGGSVLYPYCNSIVNQVYADLNNIIEECLNRN